MKVRQHLRLHLHAGILITASMLQTVSGCGRAQGLGANPQSVETLREKATPAVSSKPGLPLCPSTRSPMLRPSTVTGHHRVILSWNPSVPSARSQDNSVGYCLYRSKTKKAAKKNSGCKDCKTIDFNCSNCEQINSIPVVGIGCVDDIVEDGAVYSYVVTAISRKGVLSSPSNRASAEIPVSNQSVGSNPASSYPLCRGRASSKYIPAPE